MDVLSRTRPLALAAGPTAVGALALFFVALAVHGDDVRAISRDVLGVTANILALVSLLLLLLALGRLALRPALRERGLGAVLLAATGTVLAAGGAWAQLGARLGRTVPWTSAERSSSTGPAHIPTWCGSLGCESG